MCLQLIYLPPPWGDCKVTPMDSEFFGTYSITACRIDCEMRYLVENCNCRMVHMPGRSPPPTPPPACPLPSQSSDFMHFKERESKPSFVHLLLLLQAMLLTAPLRCTRNVLTQPSVRNRLQP